MIVGTLTRNHNVACSYSIVELVEERVSVSCPPFPTILATTTTTTTTTIYYLLLLLLLRPHQHQQPPAQEERRGSADEQ